MEKEALLTCHSGRWSTLLNVMALSSALQRRIYVAYPDCNKEIRPLVNGYISPRVATSGKMPDIYVLWSKDGCLDNTPKASFQPNHFVFLTNKLNQNLPQGQSMDGETLQCRVWRLNVKLPLKKNITGSPNVLFLKRGKFREHLRTNKSLNNQR